MTDVYLPLCFVVVVVEAPVVFIFDLLDANKDANISVIPVSNTIYSTIAREDQALERVSLSEEVHDTARLSRAPIRVT